MKQVLTPFRVGLVIIIAVVLFIVAINLTGEGGLGRNDGYAVWAIFTDSTGLVINSQVQIAGIAVGHIQSITLVERKAKVTIFVKEDVGLYSDAAVERRQASLLGDYYLALSPGIIPPKLENGDQIKTVIEGKGMDELLELVADLAQESRKVITEAEGIAQDIHGVTTALRGVLGGEKGQRDIQKIVSNIETLTTNISDASEKLEAIFRNIQTFTQDLSQIGSASQDKIDAILSDINAVTAEIRELVGGKKGDVGKTVSRLSEAMEKANRILDDTAAITEKIKAGEGVAGKLLTDKEMGERVEEAIEGVSKLVGGISALKLDVGLEANYYVLDGAAKTYASLRLRPRPDKYYLVQLISDPRGYTTRTRNVTTTTASTEDPVVVEESETTTESLKFSLEFAKRYYFVTLRGGIIESSGGVGVDLDFFRDTLTISADLFDFSHEIAPRLKAGVSYEFINHLYLTAGVDDAFRPDTFDFFFGAGIRFTDEDLKTVLGSVPTPSL